MVDYPLPKLLKWKRICLQCRRPGFDSWVRKNPWRRAWWATPVFLPGEFHGQRSLASYSPWGPKELDTTERLIHSLSFSDAFGKGLWKGFVISQSPNTWKYRARYSWCSTVSCVINMVLFTFILLQSQCVQYEDSCLASVVETPVPQSLQISPFAYSL